MTTKDVPKNKLTRTQFGNPLLRKQARLLTMAEVKSTKIQNLIKDMRSTLATLKLGVGLAAPQVGEGIALAIVAIQTTPTRPVAKQFELVLINPEITKTFGNRKQLWEGCISAGPGRASLFAKVPRYKKIQLKYYDESGVFHHETFEGLPAHVIQHEVDHLAGILFVDKVTDTTSYTTYAEYKKLLKNQSRLQDKGGPEPKT